ncbi:histone deacetylase complex subunit SAP25 [Lacerta agilis]|uniref:histone deacetylase complex subunit SAP25 n=1 Tax=Lacerta agilis TaxID=80427 RepID=UPI001419FB85|nr:histone deacetylase complex subunit SAP25 [Lacerta agilis]
MFEGTDPRHELWDTEEEDEDDEEEVEEEEEEEEGGDSDSSSDGSSDDSHAAETQESGERGQDPAPCFLPKGHHPGAHRCRRRLFAPYALQERRSPGAFAAPRSCCRVDHRPWGRETPPWETPLSHWVQDTKAICVRNWPTQQATRFCSRTLSHPSFQSFYTAVSTCSSSSPAAAANQGASPSGLEPKATPLPPVDCSGFFYTDPTMPPGHRIYNCLSVSTQEVLRSLSLETPPPIMSVCTASPPRRAGARTQWLSELECKAVSALMELPDSASQDPGGCQPSPCLPGEAEGLGEMETSDGLP